MTATVTIPVRALLLAAALAFAGQSAVARDTTEPTAATARATARTKPDTAAEADGVPLTGVLIIVGVVGLVVVIAWVCSRIGDNRSHLIG